MVKAEHIFWVALYKIKWAIFTQEKKDKKVKLMKGEILTDRNTMTCNIPY